MGTRTTWNHHLYLFFCSKDFFPILKLMYAYENYSTAAAKKSFVPITQSRMFFTILLFQPLFCIINKNNGKLHNSTEDNGIKLHVVPLKTSTNSLVLWIKKCFNHMVNVEVSNISPLVLLPSSICTSYPHHSCLLSRDSHYNKSAMYLVCFCSFTVYLCIPKQHKHLFGVCLNLLEHFVICLLRSSYINKYIPTSLILTALQYSFIEYYIPHYSCSLLPVNIWSALKTFFFCCIENYNTFPFVRTCVNFPGYNYNRSSSSQSSAHFEFDHMQPNYSSYRD